MIKNLNRVVKTLDNRFKKLPEYAEDLMDAKRKADAILTTKIFSKGIENDWFGLRRLSPDTIKAKENMGYSSPSTPLLGKGGNDKRSYKNLLNIRKLKNGYKVYPSQRLHHGGKVKLVVLYKVHEKGKTIDTGKAIIKIPQRPAGEEALKMAREEITKKGFARLSSSAFSEYMRKGKDNKIKKLLIKYAQESKGATTD